jgi:hypothetical protein
MAERRVRFHPNFFDDLDAQLPPDRSVDGTPSSTDMLVFDLPPLRDLLAEDYERVTTPLAQTLLRVMIAGGTLVSRIALYTYLDADGFVVVVGVEIDIDGPEAADHEV